MISFRLEGEPTVAASTDWRSVLITVREDGHELTIGLSHDEAAGVVEEINNVLEAVKPA